MLPFPNRRPLAMFSNQPSCMHPLMLNRREFCKKAVCFGGMVALAPLVAGCGEPPPPATSDATSTPARTAPPTPPRPTVTTAPTRAASQTPTAAATKPAPTATVAAASLGAKVALAGATDRAAGVRRAIELLGANPVSGRHVLLKPNFNSADEAPGSTHDETLRALLASLADMGAASITLADRSGMGATRQVMQRKGVFDMARTFGAKVVVLDELGADDWQIADGDHWRRGFPVPKLLVDAECVVQTCNLKTHRYGGHFTLSLKNSVGLVAKHYGSYNYMNELHGSDMQRKMIAEINAAYAPALIILDGVEAFVKGGPDAGMRAATGVILAGSDRVAIDAAGVAVLRLFGTTPEVSQGRVFEQEQIARAVELGLGIDDPQKIEFVTGDAASAAYAGRIREVLSA